MLAPRAEAYYLQQRYANFFPVASAPGGLASFSSAAKDLQELAKEDIRPWKLRTLQF
ncbi:hypothetical protein AAVH_35430 [Aphelenchoides avenae]|nr:hypothetical protein AAVH_35430 [Aphelenchus avenae]